MNGKVIGAIEAGGTKMVCALVTEEGKVRERMTLPTTTPEETLEKMAAYFRGKKIDAMGIGCFGPVDLDRNSPAYGFITSTPKAGWKNCEVAGFFERELGIPVGFDTDVNAAVLGEVIWGAAKGCDSAIYMTVGTGIGVGVYCGGAPLHGLMHPEAGHIRINRHPKDTFQGMCPFHENCVEGLAAGPAIEARFGKKSYELAECGEVWEMEAYYIGQAVSDYVLAYSPRKVILWGGVMHQKGLIEAVRKETRGFLNGYIQRPEIIEKIDDYIVFPALGENAGILGAARLGIEAAGWLK